MILDQATGFAIKSPLPSSLSSARSAAGEFDSSNGKGDMQAVVDILDAANEDPFTLESFQSLLTLHSQAGKNLILARVVTVDPDNDDKLYYSYYAAHHINKILFRTQPEEGLLHRMKAKNVKSLCPNQEKIKNLFLIFSDVC